MDGESCDQHIIVSVPKYPLYRYQAFSPFCPAAIYSLDHSQYLVDPITFYKAKVNAKPKVNAKQNQSKTKAKVNTLRKRAKYVITE